MALTTKDRISLFLTALMVWSQPTHVLAATNQENPLENIIGSLLTIQQFIEACTGQGFPQCFKAQITQRNLDNINGIASKMNQVNHTDRGLPSGVNDVGINKLNMGAFLGMLQAALQSNRSMKQSQSSAKETANTMKERTVENSGEEVSENPNESVEKVKTSLAALDTLSKQAQQIGATEAESTQEYAKLILRQNTLLHLANVQKGEMLSRIHGELVKNNQNWADMSKILAEDVLENLSELQKTITTFAQTNSEHMTNLTNALIALQKNSQLSFANLAHQPATSTNKPFGEAIREIRSGIFGFESGRQSNN